MRQSLCIAAILATKAIAMDVATIEQNVDLDYVYSSHLTKFGLSYNTVQEFIERKEYFAIIDAEIRAHNAKTDSSYALGHNKFSDWTPEERAKLFSSKSDTVASLEQSDVQDNAVVTVAEGIGSEKTFSTDNLPDALDWREKGAITPVKEQGDCQADWAFLSTTALAAAYKIAGGELYDLSAQQLVDCYKKGSFHDCSGEGLVTSGFNYYAYEGAKAIKAEDYPYTSGSSSQLGTCQYDTKPHTGVGLETYNLVTRDSGAQLRAAVATGTVGVTLAASSTSFMQYTTGIYNDPLCSDGTGFMHMLLVGYGVDDAGTDYFIMKSSLGTTWGDKGYMLIENQGTGMGVCMINTLAYIPLSNYSAATTLSQAGFLAASVAAFAWAF